MFTVKLFKGHSIKFIEAVEVNIYPCGPAPGSDRDLTLRTNEVRSIEGMTPEGKSFAFYVTDASKPIPNGRFGLAEKVDLYDCAYIENSRGATTERIFAY